MIFCPRRDGPFVSSVIDVMPKFLELSISTARKAVGVSLVLVTVLLWTLSNFLASVRPKLHPEFPLVLLNLS